MNDWQWAVTQLQELRQKSNDYQDQSFYLALSDFVTEQAKRTDQLQRELDGRMWEH